MRCSPATGIAVTMALLLTVLPGVGVSQDADPRTAPAADQPAPPADTGAHTLLQRMSARTTMRSFAAAATLTIRRPGHTRELLLRVYYHQPLDRWLLRVDGRVRERGMRVLLADQRVHVWFPSAKLTVELPSALGGERLLGSDFGVDDLALLADAGRRFAASTLGRSEVEGVRLVHLELQPRVARDSLYGAVRLTLVEQNAAPRALEFLDPDGSLVRHVDMEGQDALPSRWTATTPGHDGWKSTLEVTHYDPAPRFPEQLFTVEGLAR